MYVLFSCECSAQSTPSGSSWGKFKGSIECAVKYYMNLHLFWEFVGKI